MNPLLLGRLKRNLPPPALFQPGTRDMWTDPYIAHRALEAHFDPRHDDASRRPEIVDKSVRWIVERVADAPGGTLVDLGCGPGLYAERFARIGWQVTGIDVSGPAIDCARSRCRSAGLSIRYHKADYLRAHWVQGCSVVVLIYGGFCVISPSRRNLLLRRVLDSLAPGGYFVFDVF